MICVGLRGAGAAALLVARNLPTKKLEKNILASFSTHTAFSKGGATTFFEGSEKNVVG